jgi:hypothetical protein
MKSCIHIILSLYLCAACSGEDGRSALVQDPDTSLTVSEVKTTDITKAGITADSFTNGESVGLFIYGGNGIYDANRDYYAPGVDLESANVKYTQSTDGWYSRNPIMLHNGTGHVYAYYPFSQYNHANDGTSIPLTVQPFQGSGQSDGSMDCPQQTDYMYSNTVPASKLDYSIRLTMNHVLAMVTFRFVPSEDKPYPGDGMITQIRLRNAPDAQVIYSGDATFNIENGNVSNMKRQSAYVEVKPEETDLIGTADASLLPRMLVYPMAVAEGDLQITVTVDGNSYTLDVNAIADGYKAGNNYEYTFTLKGTKLEITNVSIKEWITQEQTGGDIQTPDRP